MGTVRAVADVDEGGKDRRGGNRQPLLEHLAVAPGALHAEDMKRRAMKL